MVYKIVKFNRKTTTTGKEMARVDLMDVTNIVITGVTIWGDFPSFHTLEEGHAVEGDIVTKGDFKTLYPARTNTLGAKRSGGVNIAKAMETKAANIAVAQENKNESIKLAAIQRDAILLVTTFYPEFNEVYENDIPGKEQAIKDRIMFWKKHLETVYGDGKPF
jgi:hypothetical protein